MGRSSLLVLLIILGYGPACRSAADETTHPTLSIVETLGDAPEGDEAIRVAVTEDGELTLQGEAVPTFHRLREGIHAAIAAEGWSDDRGRSRRVLLIEADRSLSWSVVTIIADTALAPKAHVSEIYFAVQSASGDRGALGWRVRSDDQRPSKDLIATTAVIGRELGAEAADADLALCLRRARRQAGPTGETRLDLLSDWAGEGEVPTGTVLRLFALALQAGATDVTFPCARRLPDEAAEDGMAWKAEVLRRRKAAEDPTVRILGPKPSASAALSPMALPRGRVVGRLGLDIGRPALATYRGRPGFRTLASAATDRALAWLAQQQSAEDWGMGTHRRVAATALALRAFLRHGYTNRGKHAYAKIVSRGLRFLRNVQDDDGIFGPGDGRDGLLDHAMATYALVLAYEMTHSPIFRKSAQAGLDAIARLREPLGLWSLGSRDPPLDRMLALSFGVAIQDARAATGWRREKGAHLYVDASLLKHLTTWAKLEKASEPPEVRIGRLGLRGLLEEEKDPARESALEAHAARRPPGLGAALSPWAVATFLDGARAWRWEAWDAWYLVARDRLARQDRGGVLDGSWPPERGGPFAASRVATTALYATSLMPYGHVHFGTEGPRRHLCR